MRFLMFLLNDVKSRVICDRFVIVMIFYIVYEYFYLFDD